MSDEIDETESLGDRIYPKCQKCGKRRSHDYFPKDINGRYGISTRACKVCLGIVDDPGDEIL